MSDVLVVGAGPAGAVAATILARAGARVTLVDRETFPRRKLCGDSLNPGVLALLRRLRLAADIDARGLRIEGMVVTGARGVRVEGRYPTGVYGRSLTRTDLDSALLQHAVAAGVDFIPATMVTRAIVDHSRGTTIAGVRVRSRRGSEDMRAAVTIAADGRHSRLAFDLGLTRHPRWPRRWAIGAYATGVDGMSAFGEMHIRPGNYVGVAPLPGGMTNVCLVKPSSAGDRTMHDPKQALLTAIAADPSLCERFETARFLEAPAVLGPLAVSPSGGSNAPDGLLLAGDAAGFIDPMTGDGLRFAVQGGALAASAALDALEHGWNGVHAGLAAERRRVFGQKWRFNRVLRALVGSPLAVHAATAVARVAPGIVQALILRASDCDTEPLTPHATTTRRWLREEHR